MKRYLSLNKNYSHHELIQGIGEENCMLLKRSDDHFIIGWEIEKEVIFDDSKTAFHDFFSKLEGLSDEYRFGYFSYDLKNQIEPKLTSHNPDFVQFPEAYFFVPKHIIISMHGECIYYGAAEASAILANISDFQPVKASLKTKPLIPSISRENYIKNVQTIQNHIQRGNIYEMNYCQNFSMTREIHPMETFLKLDKEAEAPFTVFANLNDQAIISASPERFLKKDQLKLISQPIKGTAKRAVDKNEDQILKDNLKQDQKERSENIMIVDLVRNDLSKIADKRSVDVEELCKAYSFKTVHQLISTVSCTVSKNISNESIFRALFPMGSMTGAPKISAMQIAEEQEDFKRGLYSGAIGLFEPNGNFDFNVVIRSILYNKSDHHVSCSVGGAITIKSDPEKEYDECILKLEALKKVLC